MVSWQVPTTNADANTSVGINIRVALFQAAFMIHPSLPGESQN
jgi:hypothetical protein